MKAWRGVLVFALTVCSSVRLSARTVLNRDEVMVALEARDRSIQTSSISVNRAWIQSAADPAGVVKESTIQLRSQSPQDVFHEIVKRLAGSREVSWSRYTTIERGKAFKTAVTSTKGNVVTQYCDGERNVLFSPSAGRGQVDIYPSAFDQINRYNLERLKLRFTESYKSRKLVAFAANSDRYSLSFEHGGGDWSTVIDLTTDLTIAEFRSSLKGRIVERAWYLAPTLVGPFTIPQVIVSFYPDDKLPAVAVVHVEDIKLNLDISDKDISVPEIPDGAVVVDHRLNPPTVKRFVNPERLKQLNVTSKASDERSPKAAPPGAPASSAAPGEAEAPSSFVQRAIVLSLASGVVILGVMLGYRWLRR